MNSPNRGSSDDSTPLLPRTGLQRQPAHQPKQQSKPWVFLVVLAIFLVTVIDLGAFLAVPPKTRVFEANLCLRYYQKHDPSKINKDGTVDEALCKINAVQAKMAAIMGWASMFEAIPGIFLALPYGILADKYGRKWIFVLALVGLQLDSLWVLFICTHRWAPFV